MQSSEENTGLGFLRSLQTALTHLTLRVETERAAVKGVQEEVATAKRKVDARATVKARGNVIDSAARHRSLVEQSSLKQVNVLQARLDAVRLETARMKQEIDFSRRRRVENFSEIVRLKHCMDDVAAAIERKETSIRSTVDFRERAKANIEELSSELRAVEAEYTSQLAAIASKQSDAATRASWRRSVVAAVKVGKPVSATADGSPRSSSIGRVRSVASLEGYAFDDDKNSKLVLAPLKVSAALWRRMRQRLLLLALQRSVWSYRTAFAKMCEFAGSIKLADLPNAVIQCERERAELLHSLHDLNSFIETATDELSTCEDEGMLLAKDVAAADELMLSEASHSLQAAKASLHDAEASLEVSKAELKDLSAFAAMCQACIQQMSAHVGKPAAPSVGTAGDVPLLTSPLRVIASEESVNENVSGAVIETPVTAPPPAPLTYQSPSTVMLDDNVMRRVGEIDAFVTSLLNRGDSKQRQSLSTFDGTRSSSPMHTLSKAPSIPVFADDLTRADAETEIQRLSAVLNTSAAMRPHSAGAGNTGDDYLAATMNIPKSHTKLRRRSIHGKPVSELSLLLTSTPAAAGMGPGTAKGSGSTIPTAMSTGKARHPTRPLSASLRISQPPATTKGHRKLLSSSKPFTHSLPTTPVVL